VKRRGGKTGEGLGKDWVQTVIVRGRERV
jgi:hypothetical protein